MISERPQAPTMGDVRLARYDPLPRILAFDDFDLGPNGWVELIGNYEHSLDTMLPVWRDMRPPMLSTVTMWDVGSHGALDGTFCLKLATRARRGAQAVAIKRLTWRRLGRIQVEAYVTVKPEPSQLDLGQRAIRGFGVLFDLQNEQGRAWPHIRYCNHQDGVTRACWQYRTRGTERVRVGTTGEIESTYHLSPEDWIDLPGAQQALCYNELPTKINWHYVRLLADLRELTYLEFQCNDRVYDLRGVDVLRARPEPTLPNLLNTAFFVEAETDRRVFLYIDSVVISTDG
jgi:hypothetical protein